MLSALAARPKGKQRRALALVAARASCLAPASARRGQCPPHCPKGHPVPPPTQRPYEAIGSIDIDTYENTIFWWALIVFRIIFHKYYSC